jgi:aminopeptidase N
MSKLQLPATFSSPQDVDKATQSNYTEIRVKHTHLEWTIDWSKHVFHGHALITFVAAKDVGRVVLDTSYLDIKKVQVGEGEVKWSMGDVVGTIGSALSFDLPKALKKDEVSYTIHNGVSTAERNQ